MTRREYLQERLEEALFALMMEDVIEEEGRKALEENERLKNDESFAMPETTYRKGVAAIKRYFARQNRRTAMGTASRVVSKVAVIVLVMLLLFTTAFATIPEFRAGTLNLIIEVFDDRTRIEFADSQHGESTEIGENIVGWLPEGFELVERGETDVAIWEKYSNSDGAFVEANIYYNDGLTCGVDTEDAVVENVVVNGYPAIIAFEENDVQIVCPVIESKRIYYIRGENVSGDIALCVAESINMK